MCMCVGSMCMCMRPTHVSEDYVRIVNVSSHMSGIHVHVYGTHTCEWKLCEGRECIISHSDPSLL